MLLEIRGKVILVTKWQKAWPHLILDILWKVEFMNYKIGDFQAKY